MPQPYNPTDKSKPPLNNLLGSNINIFTDKDKLNMTQ